jgi:hypothetical protein
MFDLRLSLKIQVRKGFLDVCNIFFEDIAVYRANFVSLGPANITPENDFAPAESRTQTFLKYRFGTREFFGQTD